MRLGISSSLAHTTPEEWASNMKKLGCRSVVFPVNYTADEKVILAYEKAARAHDLQIAEVGIWRNAIDMREEKRNEAMEYSIGQLRLADRLHARCCVNVAGAVGGERWDGAYPENFSRKAWESTVRMIQELIDEVKPQNTYFTIEPMPWMYPTGPEEYLRLLEEVGRDRFAVHMDVINMINTPERYFFPERFVEHCFELLGDRIRSCHIKDILLRQEFTFQLQECACGEGTFCLERYVELAEQADPEMPMIIEHLDDDQAYVESAAYLRKRLKLK
ncbi:MAG: sugar phosphate isomerase/epimerase [Lachnospiraceae bacterium]|nr:sugar phosphate isomerase/epimerase [Lachnospiraceae bacterium]